MSYELEELKKAIPGNWENHIYTYRFVNTAAMIIYHKSSSRFECVYRLNEINFKDDLQTSSLEDVVKWFNLKTKYQNFI